jgi:hypothetical protein
MKNELNTNFSFTTKPLIYNDSKTDTKLIVYVLVSASLIEK